MDFNERPFLVIWETTRACDLACVHCRAEANPNPEPDELSHEEAKRLIREVHEMGTPILVFSGGDPLKRSDLIELMRYAKSLGLRTGTIPAVTPNLTRERLVELKGTGVDQLAFSLDAATAKVHDEFRRVEGVFERTLKAVAWANELGMNVQINSLINIHNLERLDELVTLIENLNIVFWEIFFLVPVGRGKDLTILDAQKFEEAFEKIYQLNQRSKFVIKVTEAPHYRRFFFEKEMAKKGIDVRTLPNLSAKLPSFMVQTRVLGGGIGHSPLSVNAGKGFIFISYRGEVFPSGFLPVSAGTIRKENLSDIYRHSPILRELRDTSLLKGKCGLCAYKEICGGSRSRVYALTGDYLEEDLSCAYDPSAVSKLT
ncbi:MAG: hypothetical protein AUJ72_02080 [Candidatus Omnitrophica bacterium CG1_02_46_14]|nr:MAG: hypothetical protein AUJ72_02080 [Candidatus Omnitrophica bacterium CG1_02_46_14]